MRNLLQRGLLIITAVFLWLGVCSGQNESSTPEDLLCSGRWKLRDWGADSNHNGWLSEKERVGLRFRERAYYRFEKDGKGTYSNNKTADRAGVAFSWQLTDSSRQLIILMKGMARSYRIYRLTEKLFLIGRPTLIGMDNSKLEESIEFEEYVHK